MFENNASISPLCRVQLALRLSVIRLLAASSCSELSTLHKDFLFNYLFFHWLIDRKILSQISVTGKMLQLKIKNYLVKEKIYTCYLK